MTTLLIMAAGLGSRYGGNKQIDGLGPNGQMLMQYSIYDAYRAGFDRLVFVIKPEHRAVIERLCGNLHGMQAEFVYQDFSSLPAFYHIPPERTKPFGTVHAVLCAKDVIREPFAVINADDFYGTDAFDVMHRRLQDLRAGEGTMVAYRLKNTVSRNGSVTRGICYVEDGKLKKVQETYHIVVDEQNVIRDADSGVLDPEAQVSMNMWGFHPSVFEAMKEDFHTFLSHIPDGEIKKEFALPTFVDGRIGNKGLMMDVLSTDSVWFGVTYQEDKPQVQRELLQMHEKGKYSFDL